MDNILFLLSKVANKLDKEVNRKLKGLGVSAIKVEILSILSEKDGTMPSELARRTGRVRHDITTIIGRMMKENLVMTMPNKQDRRSILIYMTECGKTILRKATPVISDCAVGYLKVLDSDSGKFLKLLDKLDKNDS